MAVTEEGDRQVEGQLSSKAGITERIVGAFVGFSGPVREILAVAQEQSLATFARAPSLGGTSQEAVIPKRGDAFVRR